MRLPRSFFSLGVLMLCAVCSLAVLPAVVKAQSTSRPLTGVLSGIDVLRLNNFDVLRGKRVGLVTNQTGIARDGQSTIDVLFGAPGVKLRALFGPEHGLRGTATAGAHVKNGRDARTGLPIYSLYGSTRRPSSAMLRGLDAVVFDMQDIGSRSYTYISTLGEVMKACAKSKVLCVVLDRPNPIGGNRIEGNIPRKLSFVCPFPIPYCHGLTIGELAKMINGKGWAGGRVQLRVVPMLGYKRNLTWRETGLPWIATSPNIPYAETPPFYAATGIVGELSALSIGIGTNTQFMVAGAPGLDARRLESELKKRRLPGLDFRAVQWVPRRGAYAGKTCSGVQIVVKDALRAPLSRVNFELMDAVRKIAPHIKFFARGSQMFDLVCGTPGIRQLFQSGKSASQIWAAWNSGTTGFAQQRKAYLLY
ncbi:MAG: hypothetical protein JWN98_2371 [Abditibacteriota bacterium]|nr:hypothetical protein [Abditibacteriota bacterium]